MTHSPRPWTEGEWTFRPERPDLVIDGDWVVGVNGNEVIEICNASEADARIMVAAPDMAEALALLDASWLQDFPEGPNGDYSERLIKPGEEHLAIWRTARAALRKAGAMEGGGA